MDVLQFLEYFQQIYVYHLKGIGRFSKSLGEAQKEHDDQLEYKFMRVCI